MTELNPDILRWAREAAGLTPEEAVKRLGIKDARGVAAVDRLNSIETGGTVPTHSLLAKAAKHYRQPLLIFYMPKIPRQEDHGEDFRTLPEPVDRRDTGLVDAVVRDIYVRQGLVRAALEGADEAERLPFINSMKPGQGIDKVIASMNDVLRFERAVFRRKPTLQGAFAYLRDLVETQGIFVILVDNLGSWHTKISVEAFRGFALADDVAPFVAVNANDSPSAWPFTLMHELVHLWIGATGISGDASEHRTEKFCNDVASEFLVPMSEVKTMKVSEATPFADAMKEISEFAADWNVSNTMIAYKLFRAGAFGFGRFQGLKTAYRQAFLDHKERGRQRAEGKVGGPNYYVVRKHRVGVPLIRFVERMMHEGELSATKAGQILGVHASNVYALLKQGRPNHAG